MLEPILGKNIFPILRSTLNRLDGRLVDHGERVAYLVCHMLRQMGCPARRMLDLCILTVLHDIGAYKTDEVDDMILFETRRVWNHSIYGYLFIREFSPLRDQAQAVLYHHLDYERFPVGKTESRETALLLHLADGVDTWLRGHPPESLPGFLRENAGKRFDPRQVELFLQVQEQDRLLQNLQSGQYQSELHTLLEGLDITPSEAHQYLRMLVYSVDFRSETTVAHTFMMTALSVQLAWRLGLPLGQCRKIYYGAMLHDLGKIAIPTEILEFPGTLTAPQMALMRTHVSVSEEIIKDFVDPEVCRIAVRRKARRQRLSARAQGRGPHPQRTAGGGGGHPQRPDRAAQLQGVLQRREGAPPAAGDERKRQARRAGHRTGAFPVRRHFARGRRILPAGHRSLSADEGRIPEAARLIKKRAVYIFLLTRTNVL